MVQHIQNLFTLISHEFMTQKSCRWKKVQGTLHKQALKFPFKNIWGHIAVWENVTSYHNWPLTITNTVRYVVTVNTSTMPYCFCHNYPIILPTTYINITLHRQVCMHITPEGQHYDRHRTEQSRGHTLIWMWIKSLQNNEQLPLEDNIQAADRLTLCNNVWGLESLNPDDKQNQSSQEISCRCNHWRFNVFFPHSEATQCIIQCILHYMQCRYVCIMQLLHLLEFAL